MTTLAEQMIKVQRENLRKVHNTRFIIGEREYRITYVGGLSEYISVDARNIGDRNFKCYTGFAGYKFRTADEVVSHVKKIIAEKK